MRSVSCAAHRSAATGPCRSRTAGSARQRDVGAAVRSVTPEQIVSAQERAARADRVVAGLDTKDRAVVDLMAEPGLSERAAARELGVSRGSLAFRLRRARELLGKVVRGTLSR